MLNVSPWTSRVPFPAGQKPLIYQDIAAKFALSRNRSYLAMAAGTGKTPTAAMIMNGWHEQTSCRFVYICPPFLARDVESKINTWSPHLGVEHHREPKLFGGMMVLPSSLLTRKDTIEEIEHFIKDRPSALFVDEAHQFKDDEADRTRALFGHKDRAGLVTLFDRVVCMSGSPMPNRPLDRTLGLGARRLRREFLKEESEWLQCS